MVKVDVYSKAFYRIAILIVMSLMLTTSQFNGSADAAEPTVFNSDELSLQWEVTQTDFVPGVAIFLQGSLTSESLSSLHLGQGLPGQRIEIEIVLHLEGGVTQTQTPTYQAVTGSNGQFTARPRLTFPTTHTVVAHYRPAGQNNYPSASSSTLTVVPATRTLTINFEGNGSGDVVFEGTECDPVCNTFPKTFTCSSTCTHTMLAGTDVNLSPRPAPTSAFMAWTEFCQPGERVCKVHLERDASVRARFDESALGVGAGANHACIILLQRSVKCWGSNESGQLGDGTTNSSSDGVTVTGVNNALSLSAGTHHTCSLIAGGTIDCWGRNSSGQSGDGPSGPNLSDATGLSAGALHNCALVHDGTVWCWGDNSEGQLGTDPILTTSSSTAIKVALPGLAISIAAGGAHSCALIVNGKVSCWGANDHGQLGIVTTEKVVVPVTASALSSVKAIATGGAHTCALNVTGAVRCWGDGSKGQLGDGSTSDRFTPTDVKNLTGKPESAENTQAAIQIAAGKTHSCALLGNGNASCWGDNSKGQLGDGTKDQRKVPTLVKGLIGGKLLSLGTDHSCVFAGDGIVQCWGSNAMLQLGPVGQDQGLHPAISSLALRDKTFSAGDRHACSVVTDGSVRCWGNNTSGQTGNDTDKDQPSPVVPVGLGQVESVAAGGDHTCALQVDARIQCWGKNSFGQLGRAISSSSSPAQITGSVRAAQLSAGGSHTCAIKDGVISCWGANTSGQLGSNSNQAHSSDPVTVDLIDTAASVAAGSVHTCALLGNGTVACWGNNVVGQLGTTGGDNPSPQVVSNLKGVSALVSGGDHSCALLSSGSVACWGSNEFGQLGAAALEVCSGIPCSPTPTSVELPVPAVGLAAGGAHACALLTDGQLRCWGANGSGQISEEASGNQFDATKTAFSVTAIASIAGGEANGEAGYSCALSPGGLLHCWGDNVDGQLGNGSTDDTLPIPTDVKELSDATEISSGAGHTCGLEGGALFCWGINSQGQVGDGTSGNKRSSPEPVIEISGTIAVSAGGRDNYAHTCAIDGDGKLLCWGDNQWGQLGIGSTESRVTPTVINLAGASDISTGEEHTCAIANSALDPASKSVWCWGLNSIGQLGVQDSNQERELQPKEVVLPGTPLEVSSGGAHTCARVVTATGAEAWCWGSDQYGQLGDGIQNRAVAGVDLVQVPGESGGEAPSRIVGLQNVESLSMGSNHSCALLVDRSLWCWGNNTYGQVGIPASGDLVVTKPVLVLTAVESADAGAEHTCARITDGSVVCWGLNTNGQLGDGTTDARGANVQVTGIRGAKAISAGLRHTCTILFDGRIRCWGHTVALGADLDLGSPRIRRETHEYRGSSLLHPCEEIQGSNGGPAGLGRVCLAISGADRAIRVEISDRGRIEPGSGDLRSEVGGVIDFYNARRERISSQKFCNSVDVEAPNSAVEASVELYEGSGLFPFGTQASMCRTASVPTMGTITLDITYG